MKNRPINIALIFNFLLISFLLSFCTNKNFQVFGASANPPQKPKYVFLFIGDGMGLSSVKASSFYLKTVYGDSTICFLDFPIMGLNSTQCVDSYITDSGAAGTAIACGSKTMTGVIGMAANKTDTVFSIATVCKKNKWKVGILTSVSIDHATPGAFYAHQPSRKNYYEIANDIAKSDFDYFVGGGFLLPKGTNNIQKDIHSILGNYGYKFIKNADSVLQLTAADSKIIAMPAVAYSGQAFPYSIEYPDGYLTLADYTRKGIEILKNDTGFFMMVEGGKIDWACHANDASTTIKEILAFNEAVAEAVKFYKQHPNETLILVTSDHETGGMALGINNEGKSLYFDKLQFQTISYDEFTGVFFTMKEENNKMKFKNVFPLLDKYFGIVYLSEEEQQLLKNAYIAGDAEAGKQLQKIIIDDKEINDLKKAFAQSMESIDLATEDVLEYGGYDPFTIAILKMVSKKVGLGWTTYSHTGTAVGIFSIGAGAENFGGCYENSEIKERIIKVAGLKEK